MSQVEVPAEIELALGASPTEEQWRAIAMPLEPYVLVAGAGSGKTSVMAARVVYLALVALGRLEADHPGALPGNVLCLTFTNKATEHFRLRVRRALATLELPEGEEPEVTNYHGFAAQLLERHGVLAGFEPGARVLNQAQRVELCARVLDEMVFEHNPATWQPSLVDRILALDEQAQNHLVDLDRLRSWLQERLTALAAHRSDRAYRAALERIELAEAAARYRRLKQQLGVLDFGDQIERAIELVERNPDLVADLRTRYQVVLLDEYQDTNVAQARLMRAIFGHGHPVTAVGDPDQNIYAWRGASLHNLLEFPGSFVGPSGPARRLPLYTNFRSGSRILAAADRIIEPVPARLRPDPDKRLVPHPPNGEGRVTVARYQDEWSEATAIAERAQRLHEEEGASWAQIAVLCRTSRLFGSLQRAFAERRIPVEILGLAGLLKQPEVLEVLAYARAVHDPRASVSLARILLGPRYRVGFKDLAQVARWATVQSRLLMDVVDEDEVEANPFLFAEALERLDEVEGLSEEGRRRLERFRDELRELRVEARRPVGEFLEEVIRRTGILDELDAEVDRPMAEQARRNLAAFLDEVHAFQPLQGELTLRAFLDHVDQAELLDRHEWAPVQPSDEDSVKVMTIHVAKGLEFDHVFVPGLAHGLLPNPEIPQNPAERGKSLDFELRGDAPILPRFEGNLSAFRDALREHELVEERRTAYVALTRARRSLHVSGAFWYGDIQAPKKPSAFLEELMDWGDETGLAEVDRGPEPSEANPLLELRTRFVRPWPGPALRDEADELFPQGWRRAAIEAVVAGGVQPELVESLSPAERERFEAVAAERRRVAATLRERERRGEDPNPDPLPRTLSASAVIDHERCPKRFYWSVVRPLPRFSGPAARIGTEIHRWIERRASGQGRLLEPEDVPDLTLEELAGDPGRIERLREAFLASRFADRVPLAAERPFLLRFGEVTVGGRIDAIYTDRDGRWEVVDWKTGRRPSSDDPLAGLQLDVYGLACVEIWGKRAEDLTLTYVYLATGEEVSRPMGDPAAVRALIGSALDRIASGAFEPTPGPQCAYCDFRAFCEPGLAWVATQGSGLSPRPA